MQIPLLHHYVPRRLSPMTNYEKLSRLKDAHWIAFDACEQAMGAYYIAFDVYEREYFSIEDPTPAQKEEHEEIMLQHDME